MVVAVEGRAVAVRGGRQIALQRRSRIENADVIATAAETTVQLVFHDRTRMVVGPSSQLNLSDVRIGASRRASAFAVEAVSGTFRFLSGDSAKEAYAVSTPTATMGIRGTIFDFAVEGRRPTSLVTLSGEVRICGQRGACARVIGGCAVAIARPRRVKAPVSRAARDSLLTSSHPYVVSQEDLLEDFRAPVSSCGEVSRVVRKVRRRESDEDRPKREREPGPPREEESSSSSSGASSGTSQSDRPND